MPSRSPFLAQRLTRRTAIQLLGASPLFASAPLKADPAVLRTPRPAFAAAEDADRLFQAGHFAEADAVYTHILAHDPRNPHALAQRAYVAMLSNRLTEARDMLERVAQPGDVLSLQNLAATLYRLDDFAHAAPVYQRLGQTQTARLLASLGGRVPYEIQGPDMSKLPFLITDPLPMVDVSVNGSPPQPCTLDTGAPGLALSPSFADRAGLRHVATGMGVADTVTIGDFEIRNVPVNIGGTGQVLLRKPGSRTMPAPGPHPGPMPGPTPGPTPGPNPMVAPDGRPQQGVLGTSLLSHFLFTLDYAQAALILRRKTQAQFQRFAAQASNAISMPFWMAADHFMVAWGTFDRLAPMLFLIDTGGPNLGFDTTQATATAAGVRLDQSKAHQVILGIVNGRPNDVTVIPFTVNHLALGAMTNCNLPGLARTSSTSMPLRLGFDIGGTISHSFFRPFAVTFDFLGMRLFLSGAAPSCGSSH